MREVQGLLLQKQLHLTIISLILVTSYYLPYMLCMHVIRQGHNMIYNMDMLIYRKSKNRRRNKRRRKKGRET